MSVLMLRVPVRALLLLASLCLSPCYTTRAAPPEAAELVQKPRRPPPKLELPRNAALGPVIPGLQQGAIPQGLAYLQEREWLLISLYRKDPSLTYLAVIDARTEKLVCCASLTLEDGFPLVGHVGGLAVSGHHLWIANTHGDKDSAVYRIPLADLERDIDTGCIKVTKAFTPESKASFLGSDGGTLWVGEFVRNDDPAPRHGNKLKDRDGTVARAWACGYRLDERGRPRSVEECEGRLVPDAILAIPDRVQGMAFHQGVVYLSISSGRKPPSTLRAHRHPLVAEEGRPHSHTVCGKYKVHAWFLDDANHMSLCGAKNLPAMSQGIAIRGDMVAIAFESGADVYLDGGRGPMDSLLYVPLCASEGRDE